MDGTKGGPEYQAGAPALAGGEGRALKGLRRGVMGLGLHLRKSNGGVLV